MRVLNRWDGAGGGMAGLWSARSEENLLGGEEAMEGAKEA